MLLQTKCYFRGIGKGEKVGLISIVNRNLALEKQLVVEELIAEDVVEDGNCYYRAVAAVVYDDQNQYIVPRRSFSNCVNALGTLALSADSELLKLLVADICKDGRGVGGW